MGSEAEEVDSQLVAHSVITLIVGKLNKRDHLLQRAEGFDTLLVILSVNNGLADLFQTSWMQGEGAGGGGAHK